VLNKGVKRNGTFAIDPKIQIHWSEVLSIITCL
jgi:hypothetical protein